MSIPATLEIAPQPSELVLIIITCKTLFQCNFNLEIIAKKLQRDDQIIRKKLIGVIDDGPSELKQKHKRSKKKTKISSRKDFSNQCTLVVKPIQLNKEINLKVFGNGKIVITGGLKIEDGYYAIEL